MKDSTPYNSNSLSNLINHYYTIIDNKENVHKLLWLLFNIYYLECIYNEFKNSTSSTFETYARLLAVKPVKKGDSYFPICFTAYRDALVLIKQIRLEKRDVIKITYFLKSKKYENKYYTSAIIEKISIVAKKPEQLMVDMETGEII